MPFAAITHQAEGLCLWALLTLKVEKLSYLTSVHDGMAIYFALENINKK
jgi:hypothetical protein